MSDYAWMCLNLPEWLLFYILVIPYLKEPTTVFLDSKNLIFSVVAGSIWICFFFLDCIFLQLWFQICCYLWGPKGPGALNLTQPVRYSINISMMLFNDLFIYFAVVVFSSLFGISKELIRGSKGCNSVVLWGYKRNFKII